MDIEPTYLKEHKQLISEMDHAEIARFLKPFAKPDSVWTIFYWAFNVALLGYLIFFLAVQRTLPFGKYFDQIAVGFALFFFVLLPIHELIHGMVYKILGAKQIKYKANLRQLVFYAMANNFVANKKEMTSVAIAPFIILNTVLILFFITLPEPTRWMAYGSMIVHTAGCFGDFALINYFYKHKDSDLVTYDSETDKKTYFYQL